MTIHNLSILGNVNFDSGSYPSTLVAQMSLTNVKNQPCVVIPYPIGSDIGLYGSFVLPQNYVGTPKIKIFMVLDGSPANVIGFGFQQIMVDLAASADVAYEAEDTASNSTWTGYADEEIFTIEITITPTATWAAGKTILWWLYRDDSVDTTTSLDVLVLDVQFSYADA